jgi:hypothetical protein
MEIIFKLELSESLKYFIKELIMATTLESQVASILATINTIAANQASSGTGTGNNTAILAAIAGVQSTVNNIQADVAVNPDLIPVVTGISPNSGSIAGGTVVTITGSNLTGSTGATFGGVAGTNYSVTNDTTAVVTSPANTSGAGDVIVVDTNGNSAASPADQFTYS